VEIIYIVVSNRIVLLFIRTIPRVNLKFVIMFSFSDLKQVFPSLYPTTDINHAYMLPDHVEFFHMTNVCVSIV